MRNPAVDGVMKFLKPNPNLKGVQADIAIEIERTAGTILLLVKDSPELTVGLRKLLEAKDCFVRASLNL